MGLRAHRARQVERRREYVEAARCLDIPDWRIMLKHILPNCLPPLIVIGTLQIARAITLEATLSFLGLGVPVTEPSLGLLISNGFQTMLSGEYWISFYPGIALLITIVAINGGRPPARRAEPEEPQMSAAHHDAASRPAAAPRRWKCATCALISSPAQARCPPWTACPSRWNAARSWAGRRVRLGQVRHRLFHHGTGRRAGPRGRRTGPVPGRDLTQLAPRELRKLQGNRIAMIFQDPMMTLNPVLRVDAQMIETVRAHSKVSRAQARELARDTLGMMGIPSPEERLLAYPHQLSGGMRQRVAIAIAMLHRPDLIIADEPTTALDVTIRRRSCPRCRSSRSSTTSLIWITHDLSVVAGRPTKWP